MDAAETCLNVAIDHRIKKLFRPVTLPVGISVPSAQSEPQGFCSITDYIDSLRKLDTAEGDVTQRLAGPYGVTRGITVLLKQPRDMHAFDRGMAATVRDCGTLQALHDMFQTATFRTVGISDINVIDALPFVRPADEKHATDTEKSLFSNETKKKLRFKVRQFLEQIAPSVIMCASQEEVSSDPLADLISCGVGKSFTENPNIVIGGHTCCRVNSFHPSSALSYHKLEPKLRQLLLLETVQTCRQIKGTWETHEWMYELRRSCRQIYSVKKIQPTNLRESVQCVSDTLTKSVSALSDIINDAFDNDHSTLSLGQWYEKLLGSEASIFCNTVSLCLREFMSLDLFISRQRTTKYSKYWTTKKKEALDSCVKITRRLGTKNEVSGNATNDLHSSYTTRVRNMFKMAFASINRTYDDGVDKSVLVRLQFLMNVYLEAAVMVETLLGDLIQESFRL